MKSKKISILLMLLAVIFSFTSCKAKTEEQAVSTYITQVSSENNVLSEIVERTKGEILETQKALGETMDADIEQRDNSIVYVFKYKVDISDVSAVKAQLQSYIESNEEGFKSILDIVKSADIPDATLIIEYYTKDGTLIYSKEYK